MELVSASVPVQTLALPDLLANAQVGIIPGVGFGILRDVSRAPLEGPPVDNCRFGPTVGFMLGKGVGMLESPEAVIRAVIENESHLTMGDHKYVETMGDYKYVESVIKAMNPDLLDNAGNLRSDVGIWGQSVKVACTPLLLGSRSEITTAEDDLVMVYDNGVPSVWYDVRGKTVQEASGEYGLSIDMLLANGKLIDGKVYIPFGVVTGQGEIGVSGRRLSAAERGEQEYASSNNDLSMFIVVACIMFLMSTLSRRE